jgi:hypothetical protein
MSKRLIVCPLKMSLRGCHHSEATPVARPGGNFPASQCKPVTAAGFRVFPPNQTRAKVVPFPFGACSASGPAFMFVRPVTK